jgi:hypothetical protein
MKTSLPNSEIIHIGFPQVRSSGLADYRANEPAAVHSAFKSCMII